MPWKKKCTMCKNLSTTPDHVTEEVHPTHEPPTAPLESNSREGSQAVENTSTIAPTRRSSMPRNPPKRFVDFLLTESFEIMILECSEPTTYIEALACPDFEKWLEWMRAEMESMCENQVWNLVGLPDGVTPIGCKWVFKVKTDKDGNIHVFKARLVAKGFRQVHGIDYDETFSPVAMLKFIRILLAIVAFHDYEIWQMDVKTAFLNGFLKEDVYMT